MDLEVAGLVLLSAALHAGWNALVKVNGDRLAATALVAGSSALIALMALPFVPLPAPASWPYLFASLVVHVGYFLGLVAAYRHGDLSQVYPIARGAAPLVVLALAPLLAGERPSGMEVLGVAVLAAGILSLALRGRLPFRQNPAPVLYACGTAVTIGLYTVIDGLGARLAGSAHAYAVWLFVLNGIVLPAAVAARRRGTLASVVRANWRAGLLGGAMSLGAYWTVIWAMTQAPLALVAALRETSVVFAALIGCLLLGEGLGRWRIASAGVVALGIVLLRL